MKLWNHSQNSSAVTTAIRPIGIRQPEPHLSVSELWSYQSHYLMITIRCKNWFRTIYGIGLVSYGRGPCSTHKGSRETVHDTATAHWQHSFGEPTTFLGKNPIVGGIIGTHIVGTLQRGSAHHIRLDGGHDTFDIAVCAAFLPFCSNPYFSLYLGSKLFINLIYYQPSFPVGYVMDIVNRREPNR